MTFNTIFKIPPDMTSVTMQLKMILILTWSSIFIRKHLPVVKAFLTFLNLSVWNIQMLKWFILDLNSPTIISPWDNFQFLLEIEFLCIIKYFYDQLLLNFRVNTNPNTVSFSIHLNLRRVWTFEFYKLFTWHFFSSVIFSICMNSLQKIFIFTNNLLSFKSILNLECKRMLLIHLTSFLRPNDFHLWK